MTPEVTERKPDELTLVNVSGAANGQAVEKESLAHIDQRLFENQQPAKSDHVSGTGKPVERLMFVAWLALPYYERNPKTQRELAKVLGVREETLSNWKGDGALDEAIALAEQTIIGDRHAAILKSLVDKAEAGDVQAVRAYYEFIVRRAAPARVEINTSGPTQVNFGEMVRETEKVEQLPGWLIEQQKALEGT